MLDCKGLKPLPGPWSSSWTDPQSFFSLVPLGPEVIMIQGLTPVVRLPKGADHPTSLSSQHQSAPGNQFRLEPGAPQLVACRGRSYLAGGMSCRRMSWGLPRCSCIGDSCGCSLKCLRAWHLQGRPTCVPQKERTRAAFTPSSTVASNELEPRGKRRARSLSRGPGQSGPSLHLVISTALT
jgi:hypothetical protein